MYLYNYLINKAKISYKDGRSYDGLIDLVSFAPDGEGTSTYPNQTVYEKGWSQGEFHGERKSDGVFLKAHE